MLKSGKAPLLYPKKEIATVFYGQDDQPFIAATIGVTYPFKQYAIYNPKSEVTDIEYILEGEGEIFIRGKWRKAVAGDTFILVEGEVFRYRANPRKPWKKIWINYRSSYLASFISAYKVRSCIRKIDSKSYFENIKKWADGYNTDASIGLLIANYVHKLIELFSNASTDKDAASKIKEKLDLAIYQKINLDNIAKELTISKSGLIQTFKNKYGMPPYEYILSAKIETAKHLLANTLMRINEISEKLCIGDEHYFSLFFKKRVGVTPTDYRKENAPIPIDLS